MILLEVLPLALGVPVTEMLALVDVSPGIRSRRNGGGNGPGNGPGKGRGTIGWRVETIVASGLLMC
ncbi:5,10-methylenetetrahydrofolate reductase [Rhodovastum atsumiense]|nr:5,10-methylenetetrahydrofolate reductase [Rhodovastum atsumiense]